MSVMHAPAKPVRRPHINPWLAAVIALAAALVGLSAWVVVDRSTSSSTSAHGLASPEAATMLRDRLAALNSGDAKAISAFYARNAVLEERDVVPAVVTKGSEQIGGRIHEIVTLNGMQLESASPVIQLGRTVAEATSVPGSPNEGFILVYNRDANGRITHQWVLPAG